jgi:hypothetical protein
MPFAYIQLFLRLDQIILNYPQVFRIGLMHRDFLDFERSGTARLRTYSILNSGRASKHSAPRCSSFLRDITYLILAYELKTNRADASRTYQKCGMQ